MADLGPDIASDPIVSILQSDWISTCCTVATSVLVFYDHIMTLPREIDLIWGRKWSSVTILFHFNRWAIFVWAVQQLPFTVLPLLEAQSCVGFYIFNFAFTLLLFAIWAAFSSFRTFGISGRNWWLATAVCALNMVPVGTNGLCTRISVAVADLLVLLITWRKTYGLYRISKRNNVPAPILGLLLKDGKGYFVSILLALNILNVVGNMTNVEPYEPYS
ncbi:hypothetical protein CERSUDRAFT_65109 [Gelatoporia subvermispora B]|uniref:DUF6533 domain-containing protein n=1 Tax=Ceriporiopsis subvermispora (strain B) TaxID=914234 RepID=M2QKB4_CERS8|nr:hypothetical protein CERSUDRAFT_65109 [Gelatoporia subvermispora B]